MGLLIVIRICDGKTISLPMNKKNITKEETKLNSISLIICCPIEFYFSFFFLILRKLRLFTSPRCRFSFVGVTKKISCHESNYIPQFKTVWLTRPRIIFILLVAPATSKIPSPLVEKWRNNPRFGRDCCSMRSGWMHEKSYQLRRKRNKPKPISVPVKD